MALTLYAATIPSYRQIVAATAGLIEKAESFCAEKGIAPEAMLGARIADDMLPFTVQVKFVAMHSVGAIDGVRKGSFSPDQTPPPVDFAGVKTLMTTTGATLAGLDPAEIESFIGRDMAFVLGERRMPFVAEEFLLSFSQPNFYFHAATVYDILRAQGVPLGKRDFLGMPRLKV